MENKTNNSGQFQKGNASKARKWFPIIGTKYGQYTVISNDIEKTNDNKIKYIVQCSCGLTHSVRSYFLETGKQTCCRQCRGKINYEKAIRENKKVGFIKLHHEGVGNLTRTCYWYIKNCAKRRNILWDENITLEFLWNLLEQQDFKCALTKLPIQLTEKRKSSNVDFSLMTASLDRIDSTKNYTRDNIQWVHKNVHFMKNDFDQSEFINLCKLVYLNNQDNIEPSITRSCNEGAETNGFIKRDE